MPGAAAERRVVDRAVRVGGGRAQVVDPHVERARRPRPCPSRLAAGEAVDQVGEDREDVDPARLPVRTRSRGRAGRRAGRPTTRPRSDSRRRRTDGHQRAAVEHQQVAAPGWPRPPRPSRARRRRRRRSTARRPTSSWTHSRVGVVERLGPQHGAPQRLGRVAVDDAVEARRSSGPGAGGRPATVEVAVGRS